MGASQLRFIQDPDKLAVRLDALEEQYGAQFRLDIEEDIAWIKRCHGDKMPGDRPRGLLPEHLRCDCLVCRSFWGSS